MTKYLITYDCADFCGGESRVVVNAVSAGDAEWKAQDHMQTEMAELFSSEYEDEYGEEWDTCTYNVTRVEEFDENHDEWKYYTSPTQAFFYPEIE